MSRFEGHGEHGQPAIYRWRARRPGHTLRVAPAARAPEARGPRGTRNRPPRAGLHRDALLLEQPSLDGTPWIANLVAAGLTRQEALEAARVWLRLEPSG